MPNKKKLVKKKRGKLKILKKSFGTLLQASSTVSPATRDSAAIQVGVRKGFDNPNGGIRAGRFGTHASKWRMITAIVSHIGAAK